MLLFKAVLNISIRSSMFVVAFNPAFPMSRQNCMFISLTDTFPCHNRFNLAMASSFVLVEMKLALTASLKVSQLLARWLFPALLSMYWSFQDLAVLVYQFEKEIIHRRPSYWCYWWLSMCLRRL